jgi:hypothetical protein
VFDDKSFSTGSFDAKSWLFGLIEVINGWLNQARRRARR